jgi:multicomponent Na+:H+ antiporter subunit F
MMVDVAFYIFLILLAAAMALAFVRLLRGPSIADRINAADVIAICGVGLALGHGWRHGDGLWLDVAVVAGLVLFVGTTAVAIFIDPEALAANDMEHEP